MGEPAAVMRVARCPTSGRGVTDARVRATATVPATAVPRQHNYAIVTSLHKYTS